MIFRRSALEESIGYRLLWQLLTNSISYLALFGLYLYLYTYTKKASVEITTVAFLIGVVIAMVIAAIRSPYAQFIANTLPFIFTLFALVMYERQALPDLSSLLLTFFTYTLFNALGHQMMNLPSALIRSVTFTGILLNKTIVILANAMFIQNVLKPMPPYQFPLLTSPITTDASTIYLVVNLGIFVFSMFVTMLQLIVRNTSLHHLSQRLKLMSSWSLDNDVIEKRLHCDEMQLRHEIRTILSGDIRGFTAFSEHNNTKTILTVLQDFYHIVEDTVQNHKGYKPEFIADEFLTFFDNSQSAVDCAFKIQEAVEAYLAKYNLSLGIGIDRGKVLEGIVGSSGSKKYTVLGSPVNTAARLQKQAQGGEILVSAAVIKYASGYTYEGLKGISLKGVRSNFLVYRISDPIVFSQGSSQANSFFTAIVNRLPFRKHTRQLNPLPASD